MVEAVTAVHREDARYQPQSEEGASHQGLLDDEVARIDWSRPALEIDRLIRGCDPQPGARAQLGDDPIRLFGARLEAGDPGGEPGTIVGVDADRIAIAAAGGRISVARVRIGEGPKLPVSSAGLEPGVRLT